MNDSILFCCGQTHKTPSNASIIHLAEEKLSQLKELNCDVPTEFELFDQKLSFNESTSPGDVLHYFCLIKKAINSFRAGITAKRSASDGSLLKRYREQIGNILKLIAKRISSLEEKCQELTIKELINLITFTGRLSMLEDFDPNIFIAQTESRSPSHQYLHVCLDIWYISFHILCEYNKRTGTKFDILSDLTTSDDFRSKLLECILADLIYASLQRFNANKDVRTVPTLDPFFCPCHQIFFVIIKLLVENDSSIPHIHPFWFHYNLVLDSFCDENRKENTERDCLTAYKRVPSNFTPITNLNIANLWLMSNLIELISYTKGSSMEQDVYNSDGFTHAVVPILNEYEASGFSQNDLIEVCLQLCYSFVKRCVTSVDVPSEFVKCYLKSVAIPNASTPVFYYLPKTSNQWALKLRILSENDSPSDWDDKILGLMVLLLIRVISKLSEDNDIRNLQKWKKLKSDLFSALSACSIDQMNEYQLHKIFTILIVFCYASGQLYTDFIDRFRETAIQITRRSIYSKRTRLVIQWIICAAQMLPDDGDMNKVLSIGAEIFNKLAEVYAGLANGDRAARESCSEIILLYFEEISYLTEVKVESIGSCPLIPITIGKVFAQLVDRDSYAVVTSISNIIRSVRSYIPTVLETPTFKHSYGPFITNVLKDFMGFVKNQYSKGSIEQMNLPQVAANLTYFSLIKDSGRLNTSEFRYNLFQFTCHPKVNLPQREKFCEFLFQDNDQLLVQELSEYLPELMNRFLKSDESGQSRIKTVLVKMTIFISANRPNHEDELFFPCLSDIINRVLSGATVTKLLGLLEIFIKLLPEMKEKLIRKVAQRIHEMEMEGNKSTTEIKEALRKFFHNLQNHLSSRNQLQRTK